MINYSIRLQTVQDVKDFINTSNRFPYDFDLISGRYVVDGKSIIGIFSLDLSQPITLLVHTNEEDPALDAALERFLA